MEHFARTRLKPDGSREPWQPLAEHLRGVATLAERFARAARPGDPGLAEAARVAGLLHDLGKYRREFQELLRDVRPRSDSTRHKQAGTARAAELKRTDAAFAIGGHHGGMPDKEGLRYLITQPGGRDVSERVWDAAIVDCPELASIPVAAPRAPTALDLDLWTRLLFSCLVDADWLDSATALDPTMARAPSRFANQVSRWLSNLLAYIESRAAACEDAVVRGCRAEVLRACLDRACDSPGFFTLSVPTGGGKTLSAMAFALKHAIAHGFRRIIYVAPYLTIIEQNADVIRAAIGDAGAVFEHHSLAGRGGANEDGEPPSTAADHLAENWDSPIVITTNVQFFESLFANTPRSCRKVHNVAGSVVILDECQSLPRELVAPTVDMLRAAQPFLGATFVLCTATQPAWETSDALPCGLVGAREIAPDPAGLADRLRRVRVAWPRRDEPPWSWDEIAARMTESEASALCIVNTKAAAREVFLAVRQQFGYDDGLYHLSTSMCPEHRRRVLGECLDRLRAGRRCLLVSTQVVEAGVDVDFPLVLRELGPLDSIAQATGRCNREGRLGREGGRVVIFRSAEGGLPGGHYALATGTTSQLLEFGEPPDLFDPTTVRRYFQTLYNKTTADPRGITAARKALNFPEAAALFRLIDDNTLSVVAFGWEEERLSIERLLATVETTPNRAGFRALAAYSVNLFQRDAEAMVGMIREQPSTSVMVCDAHYDPKLGMLRPEGGGRALIA